MTSRRTAQITLVLSLGFAGTLGAQRTPPGFSAYPATQIVHTPGNRVELSTPEHRMFRTMLREFSHDTPDFAGHYVVATWGCGSSCESGALIDALTGHVTDLPTSVVRGLSYRLDSRLFIIDPPTTDTTLDESVPYARYYEWTGRGFRLIDSLPVHGMKALPDSLVH